MIFLRLRATLGVNLLSGGDAHHNRARPRFMPFAHVSPWEPEHEQTD
jgi:hypothetical protein